MDTEKDNPRREVARNLAEFLAEAVIEKREARERAAREERERLDSGWRGRFWIWWAKHGTGVSAVVALVSVLAGAGWTLKQYFDQDRARTEQRAREFEQERKKLIIGFSADLSDPGKRNGAAYGFAIVAGKDAIPLLLQHLVGSAGSEKDASFRAALSQAFIAIGGASLPEMIRLNREVTVGGWGANDPMLLATQPVILHFLRNRPSAFAEPGSRLSGVVVLNADLSYRSLDGLDLAHVRFRSANFCRASLHKANLSGAMFVNGVQLGSADLRDAILDGTEFSTGSGDRDADLSGARMNGARGKNVNLRNAVVSSASLVGAALVQSDLKSASLRWSDLSKSDLSGSNLSGASLYQAKLAGALLANVDLREADLEEADLSGADLAGVKFAYPHDSPFVLPPSGRVKRAGAQVVGANLSGARNVDEGARRYLCRFGALNIPGGCEGIEVLKVPRITRSGFGSGSCF